MEECPRPDSDAAGEMRWYIFGVQCLGAMLVVLDVTIVNVALPWIESDLHFSESSLVWVINAYLIPYAGFLLLGGRLGDYYGHANLFLAGLGLFVGASVCCGLAMSPAILVCGRAVQGLAGAIVSAVAFSSILTQFEHASEKAWALAIFSFAGAGAGSAGLVVGGLVASELGWRWTFLVNVPLGIVAAIFLWLWLPHSIKPSRRAELDLWGAVTLSGSLVLAVFAVLQAPRFGLHSTWFLGLFAGAAVSFVVFFSIEKHTKFPIVPLSLFRDRNLSVGAVASALWAAAAFGTLFVLPLYLNRILHFDAWRVGLSLLPATTATAVFSVGLSAWLIVRFGSRISLALGSLLSAFGLLVFMRLPLEAKFLTDVLPGMLLFGAGSGLASNPLLLITTSSMSRDDYGLASGVVNTSYIMAGAFALAILASAATAWTNHVATSTGGSAIALLSGYHLVFGLGAILVILSAICGTLLVGRRSDSKISAARSAVDFSS